ncbi:hypothetical protein IJT93_08270 [bacterium]|nr:hypothetical protein [bacterium]
MKLFIKKSLLFIFMFLGVCIIIDFLSMQKSWQAFIDRITNSEGFFTNNTVIGECIKKVQKDDHTTKLILGDSVLLQLLEPLENELPKDTTMAASNSGVLVTGYYMMAKEYLNYHSDVTDIYLLVTPPFLFYYFKYNYQYSVIPFAKADLLKYLDDDAIKMMGSVYGDFFMKPKVASLVGDSGLSLRVFLYYHNWTNSRINFKLADIYLRKLYELCEENNIRFHLCSDPMSVTAKEENERLKQDYCKFWIYDKFPRYLDDVPYYPSDLFYEDQVHFDKKKIDQNMLHKIAADNYPFLGLTEKPEK